VAGHDRFIERNGYRLGQADPDETVDALPGPDQRRRGERPAVNPGAGGGHPLEVGSSLNRAFQVLDAEVNPEHLGSGKRGEAAVVIAVPGGVMTRGKAREHGPQALRQNNLHPPTVVARA